MLCGLVVVASYLCVFVGVTGPIVDLSLSAYDVPLTLLMRQSGALTEKPRILEMLPVLVHL